MSLSLGGLVEQPAWWKPVGLATLISGVVVVLSAAYLLGFGVLAVARPARAFTYLRRFASTLPLHVLELLVRIVVGAAFVGYASQMRFGGAFHVFGMILVATTVGLAVIPWRWHRWVAQTTVPAVPPYLPLIGITSLAAGAFVLWAVMDRFPG
jgi:uncharacterized protein YjeT (DUF2065 family)